MFLPLYRRTATGFYMVPIGSLTVPGRLPVGRRRTGFSRHTAREVLALAQEYGISARLTLHISLRAGEHLDRP